MSAILPRSALALVLSCLLLAGCAAEQGQAETSSVSGTLVAPAPAAAPVASAVIPGTGTLMPAVPTPPVVSSQKFPHTIQDSGTGPAAMSLYRKAQDARAAGHPDQAEALLERAQRIEPRNPFLWQALAGVKLDLKQPDQAEEFANRSNDLARGNPYVESGNWRLIATARQLRGNSNGAVQAQNRADDISRMISP
jgi:tetratricopeptide (TPR) repeat protein